MKKAIIVLGFIFLCSLTVSAAAGDLDPTFDGDGVVFTPVGPSSNAGSAVVVDSAGRIVVAGTSSNGLEGQFVLIRYNSDGSLDTSFGTNGIVTTDFSSGTDSASSVAIDSQGRIIVAGTSNNNFAVARYNPDGSLDTTFDSDGKVTTSVGSGGASGNSVAIQTDDKIVVTGEANNGSNDDFAVVRYNTDGSLDTSFDSDGIVLTDLNSNSADQSYAVAIDSSGKIIVAGRSYVTFDVDVAVARYNTDGSLDTSFDSDGIVITDLNGTGSAEQANAVAIDENDRIVVAGNTNSDFAVFRYNTDGSLDTAFDSDGKQTVGFGNSAYATSVAIDSNGKIILAGNAGDGFAVARLDADGSLDTGFATNGKFLTYFGTMESPANAVTVDSFDRIVATGSAYPVNSQNFAVARLLGSGLIVNKTADTNDGSCDAIDCSLREAIAAANASSTNDTITFDPALAGHTITLTSGELTIADNGTLSILGLGANELSISGNNTSRVFFVHSDSTVTIGGLTISNGNGVGAGSSNQGGGIYIDNNATLTLNSSTVSNNSVTTTGGGIINLGGSLHILNSTVSGNTGSSFGGGIRNIGSADIINSTISGNSATFGGGISNEESTITLINSTVSNNSATAGGGIYGDAPGTSATINLENTIIANSTSGGDCVSGNNFSVTYNAEFSLIEDGLGCVNGTSSNNLTGDPNLAPLGYYGGTTQTHALYAESIAIDHGSSFGSTTDQRGFARPVNALIGNLDPGDGSDIGAYEVQLMTRNAGIEGDLSPRFSGDGVVGSADIAQLRLMQIGSGESTIEYNEIQRADVAPANTKGDGCIDSADVVQAELYQIGFTPVASAGGPLGLTCGVSFSSMSDHYGNGAKTGNSPDKAAPLGPGRILQIEDATGSAGNSVQVNIRVDALGDESEYGFTINFDPNVLIYDSIATGDINAGQTLCNQTNPGVLKCSIGNFPNTGGTTPIGEIIVGQNQIMSRLNFTINGTATPGSQTDLTFTSVDAANDLATSLAINGQPGTVTINAPTAAAVEVSGRVVTQAGRGVSGATVQMTDQNGNARTARTSSLGYYRFDDVEAGQTLIFQVRSKLYQFAPQVVSVTDNIAELDFSPLAENLPGKY